MPVIKIETFIAAPLQVVFDLSRSIDLHKHSMFKFKEKAVDGVTSGLINEGEEVAWTAKHLFKNRNLRVKIKALQRPSFFIDEQMAGDFKMMRHEHKFAPFNNGTIMTDIFHFESPYGFIGKCFNIFYLTRYMEQLLKERNKTIKYVAESNEWSNFLK